LKKEKEIHKYIGIPSGLIALVLLIRIEMSRMQRSNSCWHFMRQMAIVALVEHNTATINHLTLEALKYLLSTYSCYSGDDDSISTQEIYLKDKRNNSLTTR
jgi:hypothetical protein